MRPLRARSAIPSSLVAALGLAALLGLAACGTASVDGSSSSASPTTPTTSGASTAAPSPSSSGPVGPLGGRGRLVTVTGTVAAGTERGCLLFSPEDGVPGGAWVLVGHTEGLEAGQRVTLRGARLDVATTTCQQGSAFRVEEVVG